CASKGKHAMRTRQNFGGARSVAWLMLAITLLLSACAAPVSQQPTPAERRMTELLEQAQAPKALPPEVSEALLAGANESRGAEPERFDIAVSNMPAANFFLGLVSGTATNMVVHPEVEGSISLELNDVTVEEVLQVTREVFGFEYARSGGIYCFFD